MVTSLSAEIESRLRAAIVAALPTAGADIDPQVRRSDRADFQANGLLALAKRMRSNPRQIAEAVVSALDTGEVIASCEVSGPGFLNIAVRDDALLNQVSARGADRRLGVPEASAGETVVIDYSQPNVAKEMHVGHLRSTIIGDALARTLGFLGSRIERANHIGDWGTQFGMLIQYLAEHPDADWHQHGDESASGSLSRLNALYRTSRQHFDADPAFAERARERVVALQAGDSETIGLWEEIVAESKRYFDEVYAKLGVLLTDDDAIGESFYNPFLEGVADELEKQGVAQVSDGALCVFFDDIQGPEGDPVPLIVRKRDGGYGYAATDLAAVRYRVETLGADRILYVVDARQALHFRMVFETARRAGWLNENVHAEHVAFGSILGTDGKPFKTRSGDTVRLISLLDEAVDRARATVAEKSHHIDSAALDTVAHQVGIGAVKYADLANSRGKDYVFDVDRMVSLNGNTGVYLQYAHARVRSILRKAGDDTVAAAAAHPAIALEPAERELSMLLDGFGAALAEVRETCEPHRLCTYLFDLAQAFTDFFERCHVLRAPDERVRDNRIVLCRLTGDTLRLGLGLLGLEAPERL